MGDVDHQRSEDRRPLRQPIFRRRSGPSFDEWTSELADTIAAHEEHIDRLTEEIERLRRAYARWTWEERPVGEHEWQEVGGGRFVAFVCGHPGCQVASRAWERDGGPACPSRMERRRVTPWEPVPSEGEAP